MFAPTGHVRNVTDIKRGKYYSLVGPEGAISFKLRVHSEETYIDAICSHVRPDSEWKHDEAIPCDLLGGECYLRSYGLWADDAYAALQTSPAELWAFLEQCYSDMVVRVDEQGDGEHDYGEATR